MPIPNSLLGFPDCTSKVTQEYFLVTFLKFSLGSSKFVINITDKLLAQYKHKNCSQRDVKILSI